MKNLTIIMAIVAMAFTSCAKDEGVSSTSSDQKHNPNEIGFYSNTSRASIIDLTGLKNSTAGFVVYATSGVAPATWFTDIDGTNNYKYTAGTSSWGWTKTPAPSWPTLTSGYPMNFYAYYATSYAGLTFTPAPPTTSVITADYTIQAEGSQVDFLAAKVSVLSKPASGMLPLTLNHILSKINFGVVPGNGATVYVQSVSVNKVGNKRPYNFMTGDWTTVPAAFATNYFYKATTTPATPFVGEVTESIIQSMSSTNGALMLMPQTATTWTPSPVAPTNAYMGIIYRLATASDPNAVGYLKANDHPNYSSLSGALQSALNNKPLFVSVGYPFAPSSVTWAKGQGYTYNVFLGTANATNGYLTNNFYYDENGVVTTLPIVGKNTGDPINSGTINFNVDVTPWTDQSGTSIQ